jgi:hypothetical protein
MRECVVCLEELTDFVTLPCNHDLCVICYPKVMNCKGICPVCERSLERPLVQLDRECVCFFQALCTVFVILFAYSVYMATT